MRAGLAALLSDHRGHSRCPSCERLADAGPDPDSLRRALRRLTEIHLACEPAHCGDLRRLAVIRRRTPWSP